MMISSIPSPITRRRRHRRTKHVPYLVVRSPPREFPRASTSTSRSFPVVRRAEHCRVRVRQRTRCFVRSLVVVHSFDDDPVYKYSRGFNPIYYEYRCVRSTHAHTNGRPFVDRGPALVVLVLSRRKRKMTSHRPSSFPL